ncbi:MAG: SPASM domain-containing protein [Intestinibacter bartlettii]
MQAYNDIYEEKLPISKTIVVGDLNEINKAIKYINSFSKKVDYIITEDEICGIEIPKISVNELKDISLSSNIIICDKNLDIGLFKEIGFKEIYLFTDRLEKVENINVSLEEDIFKYTNRITFELSNMCGYADIHKKCPLSKEKSRKLLPSSIVYETLDIMEKYKYSGVISFHRYNEPLMYPRLLDFIRYAKNKCPKSDIFILSNGYYLTQQLLDELIEAGVSIIDVTGYSNEEFNRISNLESSIPLRVFSSKFDNRLAIYDYDEKYIKNDKIPCYWPLTDIIITRDGEVGLCHFDWKNKYSFGSLKEKNIEDIILSSDIVNTYNELTRGIRKFELCKKCTCATRTSELSWFYSNIYFDPKE